MKYGLTLFLITFLISCLPVHMARADAPPKPARKTKALKGLNAYIERQKKGTAQKKAELVEAKDDIATTKTQLQDLAKTIQSNERDLSKLERRIERLTSEQQSLEDKLEDERVKMAHVALALQRLERMPTEVLIARPSAPIETAQTAFLLQGTFPGLEQAATNLSHDLKRIAEIKIEVVSNQNRAQEIHDQLLSERRNMQALIRKKEAHYQSVEHDIARTERAINVMAREAKDLQTLLLQLQKQAKEQKKASNTPRSRPVSFAPLPKIGKAQPPLQGAIKVGFHQKNDIDAINQGVTIEGRSGGLVVAPMGGVVKYANTFKHYGLMVIIAHEQEYFSLISGFGDFNTKVGRVVKAGEPIGTLPVRSSRGSSPALYYELRYKGKPIDPARKFPSLKS